ncbi:MAG: Zn-ribbon domain-containing OB-fold protein [Gammaproteobacteria bacterium]|nr:Zn-ribbon domain-containing OB-fold protein [Gammaproteobacteria bacterium]
MSSPPAAPPRPRPVVNAWSRPFWDAAREQKLLLQRCGDCRAWIFYPRIACPRCGSDQLGWQPASGRGTIYSFTVVRSNAPSAFAPLLPYVVAVIRLEEGVQMLSNVVDCNPDKLRCDQPVEVVFRPLDDEFTLPCFRPQAGSGSQS